VPRFLGCFLLIPLLTVLADTAGIFGGWFFSTQVLGINSHHYWHHAQAYGSPTDLFCGLFKSVFFGAAIAINGCHRGFHCDAGAEGVGKAATEAFVFSFVTILALDFVLSLVFDLMMQMLGLY
jgi:phospholipid/cholesterol/gamma-HCH transport system permease protein